MKVVFVTTILLGMTAAGFYYYRMCKQGAEEILNSFLKYRKGRCQ